MKQRSRTAINQVFLTKNQNFLPNLWLDELDFERCHLTNVILYTKTISDLTTSIF